MQSFLYLTDGTGAIWEISVDDTGTLSALQLPSGVGTASLLNSFSVANEFSTSFQLSISGGVITLSTIAFSVNYPTGLEIDSANYQWAISAYYDSVAAEWKIEVDQIGPSGMTRREIVDSVYGPTEDEAKRRQYLRWLDVDISQIVHRKRAWWRRQMVRFNALPNLNIYNLVAGIATDFEQAINLYWLGATADKDARMGYVEDSHDIQREIYTSETGPPSAYGIVPGTTQSIFITPVPNAVFPMSLLYWSGYNPGKIPTDETLDQYLDATIPLIPPPFHYVVMLALQRRAFLQIYGAADPRYKVIETELLDPNNGALLALDGYESPSVEKVEKMKSRDRTDYVRSDRI